MRNIDPAMINSGTLCYCWKLVVGDESYGFTDHDQNITLDGLTYQAKSGFTASAIESGLGLKVDNLEASGALSSDHLSEEEISKGKFDGAEIFIYRVNWQMPEQYILLKRGSIGEIKRTEYGFRAELRGLAHKLSTPQGRIYQYHCDADFGDSRCRKSASEYSSAGTILEVRFNRLSLKVSGLANYPSNYFTKGKLTFTTGANASAHLEIRKHLKESAEGAVILLWQPPPYAIEIGDGFRVVAGCNKTFTTCRNKFQNEFNFRGFPHMPGNDHIHYYPKG